MPAQRTKSQQNQAKTKEMTHQPAFKPCTHQDTKTKGQETAAAQMVLPAHKKHPLHQFMQEVYKFNRLSRLF